MNNHKVLIEDSINRLNSYHLKEKFRLEEQVGKDCVSVGIICTSPRAAISFQKETNTTDPANCYHRLYMGIFDSGIELLLDQVLKMPIP